MIRIVCCSTLLLFATSTLAANPAIDECAAPNKLQVLGSGGATPAGNRALGSYVIWIDGKARILVDLGTGAALRWADSGARMNDLDVVLLSQLTADYTN